MTDRRRGSDGVRVKHWVNKNSLKFYDKGSILRVEATINEPRDFAAFAPRRITLAVRSNGASCAAAWPTFIGVPK